MPNSSTTAHDGGTHFNMLLLQLLELSAVLHLLQCVTVLVNCTSRRYMHSERIG
jgi:hypothetical protein